MKNEKTCKKKKFTIAKNSDMSDQATKSDFLKCETCGTTPCLTLTHSDYVTCRENFPCMTNKQIRFKIYKHFSKILGFGQRTPLPKCIDSNIKETWPDSEYTGFISSHPCQEDDCVDSRSTHAGASKSTKRQRIPSPEIQRISIEIPLLPTHDLSITITSRVSILNKDA